MEHTWLVSYVEKKGYFTGILFLLYSLSTENCQCKNEMKKIALISYSGQHVKNAKIKHHLRKIMKC